MTYTPEQLQAILDAHAKWLRSESGGSRANLSAADLSWARLSGADLSRADLSWANLSGANLSDARLCRADLNGARMIAAHLSGANLIAADLRWADLNGADLRGAHLNGADLRGAHLSGATWKRYTTEIVPALLRAGAMPLEDLLTPEHWECHSWENCPMRAAFDAKCISDVPALYRMEAARFIDLFDAKALPLDKVREWCGLPKLDPNARPQPLCSICGEHIRDREDRVDASLPPRSLIGVGLAHTTCADEATDDAIAAGRAHEGSF